MLDIIAHKDTQIRATPGELKTVIYPRNCEEFHRLSPNALIGIPN